MANAIKITKKEQYAIAAVSLLLEEMRLRAANKGSDLIVLDDCGVTAKHADVLAALMARCEGAFAADAKPFPEDEL